MNPLKEKLIAFAATLGFQINEESIEDVKANNYDAAYPDNWDQMSEEEQKAWKEKHMTKNVQKPPEKPEKPEQTKTNQQDEKPDEKPDGNLIWLNSLIDEMGGQDAFKGLLLASVTAVEAMQQNQEIEKANLIAALVTNSAGNLTEDDLKEFDLPVLQKMAKVMVPATEQVDYRMLGAQTVKANKGDVAEMPDIFAPETWKGKEA